MKNRIMIMLVVLAATIVMANGCGSSSGTGRYTVPMEITGGGGTGSTGGTTGPGGPGGPGTQTDVKTLLSSGWSDFEYGAYASAINKFNEVLLRSNLTDGERAEANTGLGWSLTKANGVSAGRTYFARASDINNDAKIGLAAANIQAGDYNSAEHLLEILGVNDLSYEFSSNYPIGISSAEAHAMLALAYFMNGNRSGAKDQINAATASDLSADSSVRQIRQTLITLDPTLANEI